jgi:hypothetical protein
MGNLNASMLAELQRASPSVLFLLRLDLPSGARYYSEPGGLVSGTGLYEPRVLTWGPISKSTNYRQSTLELPSTEVVLDDTDGDLSRRWLGSEGRTMRGSTATIYLASPNVAAANWYTAFVGRIDSMYQPAPLTWSVQLASLDLPLRRETMPRAVISLGDWPNADRSELSKPIPIIYGTVSSAQMTELGAVKCLYVDRTGFRYVVCAGIAKSVVAVFSDGVRKTLTTDYTVTNPVVNGRVYTVVDFVADQGTKPITADVKGMESVGDGSGTLISNPADVLAHVLNNWVYSDYRSGAWSSTAMVETTRLAALSSYFSARGVEASVHIGSKTTGISFISQFLESYQLKAWWEADKIALGVDDPTDFSAPYVLRSDEVDGWRLQFPTADAIDRIDASYAYFDSDSSYRQYLTVQDLQTGEGAPESLDLRYSAAFI